MNPSLDEITSILNHSVRLDWENLRYTSIRDLELIVQKEENYSTFFLDRKYAKNYSTLINDLLLARSPVLRHQKFWELNRVPIGVCLLLRLLCPDRKGLFYTDTIYSFTGDRLRRLRIISRLVRHTRSYLWSHCSQHLIFQRRKHSPYTVVSF